MKKTHPFLMAGLLAFVLFGCTLLVFPAMFFGVLLVPVSDVGLCAIVMVLLLVITAGLTVLFKSVSGLGIIHCIVLFVILTVMCFLNPMNSPIVGLLTYQWLPSELVEILEGTRIVSSLFFSVPMTIMSVLTLSAAALIKRVKE